MIRTLASTENPLFSQVSMSAAAVASSRRASPNQQVTRRRTRSVSAARWTNGSLAGRLDFASLMLALFCGTASLPHILIRYYTVKDVTAARKSTVVGIAAIGVFYVLTLYLGLGAMTSGAVAHDLVENVCGVRMTDHEKVRCGKIAAVGLGIIAMALGIIFRNFNVSFLVGWAFNIAASANLPALVMLLFWPQTTKQGIVAAVTVGMLASLGWILLSADTFEKVYGLSREAAPMPFSQPGLVTIPLGFLVLVVVSLLPPPPTAAPRRNRG